MVPRGGSPRFGGLENFQKSYVSKTGTIPVFGSFGHPSLDCLLLDSGKGLAGPGSTLVKDYVQASDVSVGGGGESK